MQHWQTIKPGDIVDIIAPSSGCDKLNLQNIKYFMTSIGLIPRIAKDIISKDIPYCANNDDYRFKHLHKALYNNKSKAIWCLRGGYGLTRIIDRLDPKNPPKKNKLLIGFSDITALHIFLNSKWQFASLHGPMVENGASGNIDQEARENLRKIIFKTTSKIKYDNLLPLNKAAKIETSVYTEVTGGNLCLVSNSLGTKWEIKTTNKILFLEEIGERGYKIDRMLQQMKQAGIFKKATAVIFGDILNSADKDGKDYADFTINDFANSLDIPVLKIPNIGHGKINHPLPLGLRTKFVLGSENSITIKVGL